jgi:hypothetical protein
MMPPTRGASGARRPSRSPLLGYRGRAELIHRDDLVLL